MQKGDLILDFGCGSGRDSKYFVDNGYQINAIDGSSEMCKLASSYLKQPVKCMKFEELNDKKKYDGIWACSSILHVEKEVLPEIINKMSEALKDNGVMYTCFKKGTGYNIEDGKYYNYLAKKEVEKKLLALNLTIIDYYETLPTVRNEENKETIWSNYIIKKKGSK